MPGAYTSTSRRQNLSTTATLIHRLRHSLRNKGARQPPTVPNHSPSARINLDKRRSRTGSKSLEAPTSSSSRHELVQIEDRGEYTQPRYGNVNMFWNSVMVEANEQEDGHQVAEGQSKRTSTEDSGSADTSQLYNAHQMRSSIQTSRNLKIQSPQQTSPLTSPRPSKPTPTDHPCPPPPPPPSPQQPVTLLPPHDLFTTPLTWNKALTRILTNPRTSPSLVRSVLARSQNLHFHPSQERRGVQMRDVAMVPNFSYPICGAWWYRAWYGTDQSLICEGDDGKGKLIREDNDVRFLDLEGGGIEDENELYRASTPVSVLL